ncbi:MAG: efflux RND transporter periplasmic adaptor subunit [Bacilli bacterium]
MDNIIEHKSKFRKRHIPYIVISGIFIIIILYLIFSDHRSTLHVDSNTIITAEVKSDIFHDYIRINGNVEPIMTVQLTTFEGGMVQDKLVEEGAMIKKGDVVIKLANPQLTLQILESEASLAEKENWLRNTRVTMEQEKLALAKQNLDLNLDVTRKKRKFEQNKELYKQQMIPKEDFLTAKEDFELSIKSKELVIRKQTQDSIYRSSQILNMENSLESMHRSMKLVRQRMDNLNVKSPISGQLGSLDVLLGISISSGTRIGQINDLSSYKIVVKIDEHYIDRVRAGLNALFERNNRKFPLVVKKVYPQVKEGLFKTDLAFVSKHPDNIRSGQTYYIDLELGQSNKAILIPRGAFYQQTGGRWIYVLSADKKTASKREIKIGRQNPKYYEVLEGLKSGEQVIVSSYNNYGDNEVLILK